MLASEQDHYYMGLALKEARKGIGRTSPNPCVGAVIVRDQTVIATGYHKKAGTPHAEIHALNKAGALASSATLYVTLEPCNHTGKTPPCTKAIIASGIRRVVVGMEDPNPLVDGGGNSFLQRHGVEVLSGVLAAECRLLNRPFIKYITQGLPWVVMKAGMSLDGRISYQPNQSGWITGPDSLRNAHRLRDRVDAILVGSNTVMVDDPSLTTRLSHGKGRDPIRVILDTHLNISEAARLLHLDSSAPTWIFCGSEVSPDKIKRFSRTGKVVVHQVGCGTDGRVDLREILTFLSRAGVISLLVEGGATVHGAFLSQKLIDHVNIFIAPIFAGNSGSPVVEGVNVSGSDKALRLHNVGYKRFGEDIMIEGDILYYPS
ncbi:MAG: bifunctional diaminohydroxyphosphoribosylaminopyrimidine deaminase/5-amino-6-(5-phosphoribosylamino)uracil reductase RibD [Proteobacteria bacterium]|nr:bifunctional diaminohydroxyphosphoribosylaminopyrimidine deaminase/5-amino-6-(5-phosphoribosylamino)uracil reductase RibD [Pseudomonadota bacterium]MCG2745428.1 bifunctional diaminohydroxyphosphoribosylaminopyrimidine deaminase/5-amino-6-(5-phosphoribosylamino)uracil reductase RibD [Desulfobacteraceae bacterium]MBU3984022.1 bifunctional diaminohydroxyphosphoribosylaminopyrimidine deaminase/5-amino-6-(5-phosphoribosylamino)uracil reductase RibD [Pseudomonadota bacterium]MBU4030074.1 bifunction